MNDLIRKIRAARNPVALTGAGISAPSGIPTFQGDYHGVPLRDLLTREVCEEEPLRFFDLFCDMVMWCDKEPNPAHLALAELGIPVLTQNIDGLHTRAGSSDVTELHGTLQVVRCRSCGYEEDAHAFALRYRAARAEGEKQALAALTCPVCGKRLDSDVVLYGDNLNEKNLEKAYDLASTCDLMLVIGTSLVTYPAAALPGIARRYGAEIVMINEDCVRAFTEEN